MILFVGDSLAVGTPLASVVHERVVKRAETSIGTTAGLDRFLRPLRGARVLVVSLGTNDGSSAPVRAGLRRVRRARGGRCVVWLTVTGVPAAGSINRALGRQGWLVRARWARAVHEGRVQLVDGVHPGAAGYRYRARLIRRAVKRCPR